jgi:glycosyltransferase involved in cell wall biosynthesis
MYGSYATLSAAHSDWLDIQVASSQVLAAELVQRGADPAATRAITINLDINEWDPAKSPREAARRALGCAPGQPLILFAGRTSSEKRPLLAVECWKQLITAGIDARFAIVGVGAQLQETKAAVVNAGLSSRVVFLGELDSLALREVYAAADVFHAPSEIEGIARSLFEAMAMECVPVVADVGGQRELVTPDCGFLIPHGPNEVARYVDALIAAIAAPDHLRLTKAARARIVGSFTADQCVAGFESAFAAAIERRRADPTRGLESKAAGRELAVSGLEVSRRHYWKPAGR